jgi:ATP-dependent Clp protease ATP-binding subunit ClpB
MQVVGQNFRPEFINRIDDTVVFHPLGAEQIQHIALFQIERLKSRLHSRDLELEVEDEAVALLAEVGFDPVYGARPLKRALQTELENPLAQRLLHGDFAPGATIRVGVQDGELTFTH